MECTLNKQMTTLPLSDDESFMEMGAGNYGCAHYRRRCKVRAPCCDEIFDCRHCHNDSKNALDVDPLRRHDLPRHDVKRVICSLCNTEQDVSKNQYHCDKCGICRMLLFNFTQGITYLYRKSDAPQLPCLLRGKCRIPNIKRFLGDNHESFHLLILSNFMQYVFDTTKNVISLPCGHTMHLECVLQMEGYFQYSCPLCSRSYCDMSSIWEQLDQEVASTPMPEMYQNKMVWILCNDCAVTSEVNFHIVALKCPSCKSYNTKQIRGGNTSYANITEMVS
ncbi:putative peptidyl-prolyl cis-trans isomerase CYP21-3, mitochondrial-like [Capsicum annuum]|nr:putative peptidyl-prolyl cis-trans isomerase CYP21-3, mitochondrial-like [Capsicum annuum]